MSNQFLKLRRSAVPGRVPSTSSIDFGEIALNTFDGLAFIKRSGSNGEEVVTLGSREGAFTGSFSGSFVGNGAGLFNVPASGIVGLNLSQIATGSVSASVGVGASSFSVVSGSNTFLYISSSGNIGINNQSPTFRLDINGSFRSSGSITATSGSDYFDISHDITQPAQTGSQVFDVNVTPTFRYTAPNQTQTAFRVAATFSGSTALSSSQSNIIADFGSTSAGSQLVVNDTTSGSIYMVNDVSGLPIIEANSNWDVFIYDYPTRVFQKSGSNITISGSLNMSGSITIGSGSGDLYMYGHKMFSIGQFQNNSTLSGSANVSQSFVYDTTDFSEGVTLVSGSRLTVANAGHYNIQFSAQLQNTVNTTANLWIWFKINGTNVPESATRVVLRKDEYHIAAWNFAYPANANDYFEIAWQSDSADTRILYEPASGNIPIIPSIITTVVQIR
jgi:hypothetical protein